MHTSATTITAGLLLAAAGGSNAIELNINNTSSVKNAAKTIAGNVVHIYNQSLASTGIPGLLEQPYYWWTGGLMFDSLINYWALTGDASYNDLVSQGMLFQVGSKPYLNFMPSNQTKDEGNDDQSTWGLAAMTAAEKGFPAPPKSSGVQSWVELAANVFNSQVARWDASHCGGGLRWQIFPFNAGYNYKNSASNGNFLQLAGRLAHFTGNKTYADWAQRTAEWSMNASLIQSDWQINDGVSITDKCSRPNTQQWTDNYGDYLGGWAYMANYTTSQNWNSDVPKLVSKINDIFVKNGVITEVICAPTNNCNTDATFFRAILARALANTAAMVPSTSDSITSILRTSAEGAAGQCSGTSSGTACGMNWNTTNYDGTTGLGQELSALEIILANLPAAKPDTEDSSSSTSSTAVSTDSSSPTNAPSSSSGSASMSASTTASQSASSTTPSGNAATTSPSVAGDVRVSSLGGIAAVGLAMAILA